MVNLFVQVVVYAMILLLVNSLFANGNMISLYLIFLVMLVVIIAYSNYIALQLKKRVKEFYVRKLLGAEDIDLTFQLLLESSVLTTFLVVSAMVLTELITPWCSVIIGGAVSLISQPLYLQLVEVSILVLLIGLLAALIPIRGFIRNLNKNFVKISRGSF